MQKEERWAYYRQQLERLRGVTAAFAVSDHYAIDLMSFLRGQGIAVPEEISVAGFDDTPVCEMVSPALTTVRQDGAARARIAMEKLQALREGRKLIDLGAADEACLDAMSIMEFSNAHGTIVCMPTGGASGIVPAAVYRTGEQMSKTETEQENALLVAGLIGAFYYPTHYTGAIGCQAEIGVAVSMASAALCSMMTDDPDTIHCAASLGGQVLMGLLCNPIEGYVQVPCIVRNMAAVPTAVTCANAALAGMDHIVPLDDVVNLMLAVGEKIRPCDEAGTYILKKEEA